ncbi:MAG: YggT family protein [Atopobiaceae bacterium]|jgi:YggT family protein|nr:YggT family protein [Atopobiaceae bacterium]
MNLVIVLIRLIEFYQLLIVVWCILTWVPMGQLDIVDDIKEALGRVVRPYLDLFSRIIPTFGGIDFSPILAIIVLSLLERLIVAII